MVIFPDNWWYYVTAIFTILVLYIIIWMKKRYSYWANREIASSKAAFLFGDLTDVIFEKETFAEYAVRFYNLFKSKNVPHGGNYFLFFPTYMPIDLDIVKSIMQTDFQHFVDRGVYFNEESDPLSAHLFAIEGPKWRNLRAKLTPTFTSGKLKMMFETLVECSKQLEIEMDKLADKESIDIKDYLARFTMDVICSCAFGIETNILKNPDNEFREYGEKLTQNNILENITDIASFLFPDLMRKFGTGAVKRNFSRFFLRIMKETVDYREQNNVRRKDFMDLLLQLKNHGKLSDDDDMLEPKTNDGKEAVTLTFNELAAQCFVFFLGGFETSSTTMTFCLYELCRNEEIQEKLRKEINEVLGRHAGKITYEAMMDMKYMEKVINETLRMYPPLPTLQRICTKEYTVPGTNLILEKGMRITIPVVAIHHDPEHYPKPEVFDPERFSEEVRATRHPFAFLPFGEGPRVCIGLRFGMMQTKVGLTVLLKNYKFKISPKTQLPIKMDPKSFLLTTKGGMWLNYTKV